MVEQGAAEVRIVSAAWGELSRKDDSVEAARVKVLNWASKRTKEAFPEAAFRGERFELALGHGEAISDAGVWAFRFDTADEALRETEGIERRWRTEVVIAENVRDRPPLFSVRLSVVTAVAGVPFVRSAPALIRELAKGPGILFGGAPKLLNGVPLDAAEFGRFLQRRDRRPIVAISESLSCVDEVVAGLERALIGFAHVVRIDESISLYITHTFGRRWSVFDGGIRAYFPGVNFENQTPFLHPVWTKGEVPVDSNNLRRFIARIQRRMLAESAARVDLDDVAPGFISIESYLHSARLQAAREQVVQANAQADAARTDVERLAAAEGQVEALSRESAAQKCEIQSLQGQVDSAIQERDFAFEVAKEYEEEIGRIKSQFHHALNKVSVLNSTLESLGGLTCQQVDIPNTFDDLQDWAQKYYPDRLVITAKSIRSAKKSVYEDIPHIYKCLQLLAVEYCDMRRGCNDKFVESAAGLRVEVSDVGVALNNHRYKQQFEVSYNGGYEIADLHLAPAKGTAERGSVDPKRSYRIYFFWDEQLGMVVVASLPGHLNTTLTT